MIYNLRTLYFKENQMTITVSADVVNERALEMSIAFKKLFDEAKRNQRSKLFANFGAIAAHLANDNAPISEKFKAVGLDGPDTSLCQFFDGEDLAADAIAGFNMLAVHDNVEPDSWGSFMEFAREQFS
jgi:hypothetical protein